MTQPVPITFIKKVNMVFGSVDTTQHYRLAEDQIPSCYYMTDEGSFARFRPLHIGGFAIEQSPTHVVGMYAGVWDDALTFAQNQQQNNNIKFHLLGSTKRDILDQVDRLHSPNKISTNEIQRKNNQIPGILDNRLYYINDGPLHGIFFQQVQAGHPYQPMHVVDAPLETEQAHRGHVFMKNIYLRKYYESTLPDLISKLELCGVAPQTLPTVPNFAQIDTAPKQPLVSNEEYFPENAFGNSRPNQSAFIQACIRRFQ
ncbi:hypothetical protein PsAD13_01721 [Pseudovibrio sp. Ad13]|uniref:hypothetical protein n=1 Tax=Pseudovibrio sp. Ad13 TaxID=989396 RepID=UPI0007B1F21B|nr:hypothetical protein [Pseudovibrio sp. Ad13]KZK85185.1 hypothetical protein PsAD13_01721 [Pseudovibrio sp. Ad13]